MKKTALTVLVLALGMGIGFAQSAPQKDGITATAKELPGQHIDKKLQAKAQEADPHAMSIYALPEIVLEQIKYSELAGHTILSVREVQPVLASEDEALQYELLLQDKPGQDGSGQLTSEPVLLVRYDEYGELLFRKELPMMAQGDE